LNVESEIIGGKLFTIFSPCMEIVEFLGFWVLMGRHKDKI